MTINQSCYIEKNDAPKSSRTIIFDATVLLTLGSGLLYILGWTYWSSFFQYFGVKIDFVAIEFNQIVSSTWWLTFPFIMFFFELESEAIEKGDFRQLSIRAHNAILFSLGVIVMGIALSFDLNVWFVLITYLLAFAVTIICSHKFHLEQKLLSFDKLFETRKQRISFLICLVMVTILAYGQFGRFLAKSRAEGRGMDRRITIKSLSGTTLYEGAILLTHMNGKYYICMPTSKKMKPELSIVQEGQIQSVLIKSK